MKRLCLTIAPTLINTYRGQAELCIMGKVILSRGGTTQGNPLAMAMYALAVVPLLRSIRTAGAALMWFADDVSASGYLDSPRKWWDALIDKGPANEYFPNGQKTWLVVKQHCVDKAQTAFEGTGVNITSEGRCCLEAAVGTESFVQIFVQAKVTEWSAEIEHLAKIAKSHPQEAYTALTHGLQVAGSILLEQFRALDRNLPHWNGSLDAACYQTFWTDQPQMTGNGIS